MTAPDKIWHEIVTAKDMDELYGFGISPDDWNAANFEEYTRAALVQAAVAAAYEAAAQVCDSGNAGAFWGKAIRALATPYQIAALAAERAATVTVKPLVWEDIAPRHSKAALPLFGSIRAESWGGDYSVVWSVPGMCDTFTHGKWATLEAAKAAAQADYDARIRSAITITNGAAEITRLRAVIAKDAAQITEDQHKMHEAVEVLREVIDFACALNNVAAGQNPERLDRWSAVLAEIGGA